MEAYNLAITEKDIFYIYNICKNHDVLRFFVEAVGFSIRLEIAIISGRAPFPPNERRPIRYINSNTGLEVDRAYFLPFC